MRTLRTTVSARGQAQVRRNLANKVTLINRPRTTPFTHKPFHLLRIRKTAPFPKMNLSISVKFQSRPINWVKWLVHKASSNSFLFPLPPFPHASLPVLQDDRQPSEEYILTLLLTSITVHLIVQNPFSGSSGSLRG